MSLFTPMPAHPWVYPAKITRVIDGDTVVMFLDLGFANYGERHVRLAKINSPEITAADNTLGLAARQFVVDWVAVGVAMRPILIYPFLLESNRYDNYGRVLGTIWRMDGHCLNQDLLDSGHAVVMK